MSLSLVAPTRLRPSRAKRRRGGLRDYISPTRLNLWLKCPLAFKFRYVEGITPATAPALFLGKVVHRALQFFYEARPFGAFPTPEEVEAFLFESWRPMANQEALSFASADEEGSLRQQACDLVLTYLRNRPVDEPPAIAVEMTAEAPLVDPATGEDLGIPMFGTIDLILNDPAGPLVVDFKTAARGGALLEIAHEVQLTCYAYLFRHLAQRAEHAVEIRSLIKTKTPKVEYHRWPARRQVHFRRLFAVVRAYLESLDTGRFVFRPNWGCSSCEFCEVHCRAWRG